jgi:hypothetical protein
MLRGNPNPVSQQFFEPVKQNTLLPMLQAKEKAHNPNNFRARHRSVDPRRSKEALAVD